MSSAATHSAVFCRWPNVKQLEAKVVSFLEESVKEAVAARNDSKLRRFAELCTG